MINHLKKLKIHFTKENLKTILDPKKPLWIFITIGLLIISFNIQLFKKDSKSESETSSSESSFATGVDTFVPAGFVLVTLQLSNQEAMESMISEYALVDLYSIGESSSYGEKKIKGSNHPIAVHLKLIRSPIDHSKFGVLVPDDQTDTIQKLANPVFAVLQGPNAKKSPTKMSPPKSVRSRSIQFGNTL